jgi:hypothetical protein
LRGVAVDRVPIRFGRDMDVHLHGRAEIIVHQSCGHLPMPPIGPSASKATVPHKQRPFKTRALVSSAMAQSCEFGASMSSSRRATFEH